MTPLSNNSRLSRPSLRKHRSKFVQETIRVIYFSLIKLHCNLFFNYTFLKNIMLPKEDFAFKLDKEFIVHFIAGVFLKVLLKLIFIRYFYG